MHQIYLTIAVSSLTLLVGAYVFAVAFVQTGSDSEKVEFATSRNQVRHRPRCLFARF